MDASIDHDAAIRLNNPGRFTRVFVETRAGEIEARLSEYGNWELRVRRHEDRTWRLACTGDLDCGAVSTQPVIPVDSVTACGPLLIEPPARRVSVAGKQVSLARKEFDLLLVLASKPEHVFNKQELMQEVWGYESAAKTRTLESHISRLRCKLAAAGAGEMVINAWGIGYRLWNPLQATSMPSAPQPTS